MLLCGAGPPACAGVSAPLRSRGGLGGRRRPGGPPPQDQLTDDSENQLVLRTCACRVGTFADAGLPSRGWEFEWHGECARYIYHRSAVQWLFH